jgi:hypothetical protein
MTQINKTTALWITTFVVTALAIGVAEFAVRWHERERADRVIARDAESLMKSLPQSMIAGREISNQMIAHNVALFSRHAHPMDVTKGYVGTSRSKVIRPNFFGVDHAVNGSGNSYNEISYGLLLQAEIMRRIFPNMKRLYVESSMLLRRPARLIVEPDHRKYLPLLDELVPILSQVPNAAPVLTELRKVNSTGEALPSLRLALWERRSSLRLSSGVGDDPQSKEIPVGDDPFLLTLDSNGERKNVARALEPKQNWVPEIKMDNAKVQRIKETASHQPWDGLFDAMAVWGKHYQIEIVFFQPPVRSDLLGFQQQLGLGLHVADMNRVARENNLKFIDLNRTDKGFAGNWSLFNDEDHLETCVGSGLLTLALESTSGNPLGDASNVSLVDLQSRYKKELSKCQESA